MLADEAPKITDWMQGLGSLAALAMSIPALVFTALLYRHEVGIRRKERADADVAQARLVFGRVVELRAHGDMLAAVRWEVVNHSASPVFQVTANIFHSTSGHAVQDPNELEVLTNRHDRELRIEPPVRVPAATTYRDLSIEVAFTDAAGLLWRRTDRAAPQRVLQGAAPRVNGARLLACGVLALSATGTALALAALFA
ncbi:hypothetical protein ACFFKH_23985 [Micromonospora marina]|uniref:Uncharacterized protein n=1 Tax=Micromonospora marina TaxID=307120 RepID=A0A1C4V4Q4_9ACTN|nr:hypothetical protein [Micromonospora marina]SCE78992.1 hypothetical protein GA0070215_102399 [Micromonospora marina]